MKEIEKLRNKFKKKLAKLNEDLKNDLLKVSSHFNKNLDVRFTADLVIIGVKSNEKGKESVWASEVKIYPANVGNFPSSEATISYPTSGSFVPNKEKNDGATWRTLHSAIIIQNWEAISKLAEKYCKSYQMITDEFFTKKAELEKNGR